MSRLDVSLILLDGLSATELQLCPRIPESLELSMTSLGLLGQASVQ
jgi:hypothetical protein